MQIACYKTASGKRFRLDLKFEKADEEFLNIIKNSTREAWVGVHRFKDGESKLMISSIPFTLNDTAFPQEKFSIYWKAGVGRMSVGRVTLVDAIKPTAPFRLQKLIHEKLELSHIEGKSKVKVIIISKKSILDLCTVGEKPRWTNPRGETSKHSEVRQFEPMPIKNIIKISEYLEQHFSDGMYKGNWSDEEVAEHSGFSVTAVAKVREEAYGPIIARFVPTAFIEEIKAAKEMIADIEQRFKDYIAGK
jgi:hypothetical protein